MRSPSDSRRSVTTWAVGTGTVLPRSGTASGPTSSPDDQGGHRPPVLLRHARPAPGAPHAVPGRLQLRPAAEDPARPHALRVRVQELDGTARAVHPRSDPRHRGTEHLVPAVSRPTSFSGRFPYAVPLPSAALTASREAVTSGSKSAMTERIFFKLRRLAAMRFSSDDGM